MKESWTRSIETELEGVISGRIHRWPFLIAVVFIGTLLSALSANLTIGPTWAALLVVCVLSVPLLMAVFLGHHRWTRRLSLVMTVVVTLSLMSSVIFLVYALLKNAETALHLFRDAAVLWVVNVIVFAIWYWEVDQGGPIRRHTNAAETTDFLFPQMTVNSEVWAGWKPAFSDYVFLAFNTSTAFSPTDTLVLSRKAKILMMIQASISLVIVAVLAARAINIV